MLVSPRGFKRLTDSFCDVTGRGRGCEDAAGPGPGGSRRSRTVLSQSVTVMTGTRDRYRPLTYSKMKGLVSFFSALIRGNRVRLSGLLHKLTSGQHFEAQKILKSQTRLRREEVEEEKEVEEESSVSTETALMKPSDFHFLKVIGRGSFGKVLLARHRTQGGYYAVKVLQKQTIVKMREQRHVMVERSVLMKALQHPFLVGLHFSFQTPQTLYFVLDYVNGGELFYHLQREGSFPEHRCSFYAAEMALALGYLHSLHIVYRDLKPENVLLDRCGHVMLTDFGLCKEGVASDGMTWTFCGTPEYLAPEVLRGEAYGAAVDWWGLGAVLFEMLHGLPPFYSRCKAQMLDNILRAPLTLRGGVTAAARSLLEQLLERDVSRRLGRHRDLVELQEHPFFTAVDWDDLLERKVAPPFVPDVSGPCDVSLIDPEFTKQPVNERQGGGASEAFPGFTFMSASTQLVS